MIEEKKFWVSEEGDVDFTKASDGSPTLGVVSAASERRLRQIGGCGFLLDSPSAAPVIPESIEFSRMTDFAERKELVRAKQRAINDGDRLSGSTNFELACEYLGTGPNRLLPPDGEIERASKGANP